MLSFGPSSRLLSDVGVTAQVDHIDSAFVTVKVTARTDGLTGRQRMLLPLLLSALLESPVLRAGATVPWESVVQQLAAITLDTGCGLGFGGGQFSCGSFAQLAQVSSGGPSRTVSHL